MDRAFGVFIDGIGSAAATSGVLSQLQGRIFALLYLHPEPLSLDDIAEKLQQSKSNISVNVRGLIDWHLVRRTHVGGSRKDHYEAITDFWRVMQEIMERRFRWTVRQVLASVEEAERMGTDRHGSDKPAEQPDGAGSDEAAEFLAARLDGLRTFFSAVDMGLGAFTQGSPFDPETLQDLPPHKNQTTPEENEK